MTTRTQTIAVLSVVVVTSGLILGAVWYSSDSSLRADSTSDSPDGKYRCAFFDQASAGRFALYEKGWWWHELPGVRGNIYSDSLSLTDVRFEWDGHKVTVTGKVSDDTKEITGQVVDGKQVWPVTR